MAMMTKEEFRAKRERAEKDISEATNIFEKLLNERVKELNENTYKEFIGKKVEVTIPTSFHGHVYSHTVKGYFNGIGVDTFNRIVVTLNRIKSDGTRSADRIIVEEECVRDVKIIE